MKSHAIDMFRPAVGNRLPGIVVNINPEHDPKVLAPITFERDPFFAHVTDMTRPSFARLSLPRPQLTKPLAGLCSR